MNPSYTNPNGCEHLTDFKLRHGASGFVSLRNRLETAGDGERRMRKLGEGIVRCSYCKEHLGRLYMCLICSSVACSSHFLLHKHSSDRHDIALDIERTELYCCSCSDQVYDPDFDSLLLCKRMTGSKKNGFDALMRRSNGKRRLDNGIVSDTKRPKILLSLRERRAKWTVPLGLRGLNNLGSTCFMNSVLQALVQAPPLKNYFLNNQHNRNHCRKVSAAGLCLICDVDIIFSAMFSGDRTPYSPAQFLYSWWQHSVNLANYEQQDSHEFFISLLDGIHEKDGKLRGSMKDCDDCQCVTHKAFSGLLRSDVTCMTCGSVSSTYDPFIDISLDVDTSHLPAKDARSRCGEPSKNADMPTLSGCLDFFTRSERLGPDQKLHCEKCREKRDSLKQMSIKRLPLVLSLHVKRFEHSLIRRTTRKVDHYVQFPFRLDMTPYLSSSVLRSRLGNRIYAIDGESKDPSAEFEIFAVITHSGMLESGHYVTYLRLRNRWYKCDDAWITEVDDEVVRASQCYMLFYVQKLVLFRTNEELSCFPTSPTRGEPFYPIAGCC